MEKAGFLYIKPPQRRLCLGVTSDLAKRAWKIREIEGLNPDWDDVFERLAPL